MSAELSVGDSAKFEGTEVRCPCGKLARIGAVTLPSGKTSSAAMHQQPICDAYRDLSPDAYAQMLYDALTKKSS